MNGVTVPPAPSARGGGLLLRVLSAFVMLPVAVGLLYLGGWFFAAVLVVAALLMAFEWQGLVGGSPFGPIGIIGALALAFSLVFFQLGRTDISILVVLAGTVLAISAAARSGISNWWHGIGVLWFGLPCLALLWLRQHEGVGFVGTLWLMSTVWACDTGAYFAGRAIGGPKLAPTISPKKTWAGLLGGMLAAAVIGLAFTFAGYTGAIWTLAFVGAVVAAVSQVGDLAESAVKRHFDRKDSGTLIPGHGGVLDRVDGLLFAAPAAVALLIWGKGIIGSWG